MAKVTAPLMSFTARGKIADALVFFPWKGINAVRQYVIPANPRTAAQLVQRAYMTAAVAAVHAAQTIAADPIVEADTMAYSLLAAARGMTMTWFNMACKLWLDGKVAGDVPHVYRSGEIVVTDKDDFRPAFHYTSETPGTLAAGRFYLGTSRTALIQSEVATIAATEVHLAAAAGFSGLTAGIKYFVQFRPNAGDGAEGADSGIYYAVAT